jgi:hypothetical protein
MDLYRVKVRDVRIWEVDQALIGRLKGPEKNENRFIRSTASLFFSQSVKRNNHFFRLRA